MSKLNRSFGLLALSLAACVPFAQASSAAQVFKVTSYKDDGSKGTLRWALEQNAQHPDNNTIDIEAVGHAPYVIKIKKPLPGVMGPVKITFPQHFIDGSFVSVDGSGYIGAGAKSCPGAVPGQFGTNVRTTTLPGLVLRDTHGVDISGLNVTHFCIGILINRASNNVIHDNMVSYNLGGSGIMTTGDDGKGNSTHTTTNNNKILRNYIVNNGDGMELTRGAAFNLLADNTITLTDKIDEPSQGLEILWGNDNTIVHNHFSNYSDGVQLNWGNRNYIGENELDHISSGVTVSGTGNMIVANKIHDDRAGISVRPQAAPGPNGTMGRNRVMGPAVNRISMNEIYDNGKDVKRCFAGGDCIPGLKGGIVFGVPGLEHASFIGNRGGGISNDVSKKEHICQPGKNIPDCEPMPNHNQPAPKLTLVKKTSKGLTVYGVVNAPANTYVRVELFSNDKATSDEAKTFVGFVNVAVNAKGEGSFSYIVPAQFAASAANFTSTVTTADGATSRISAPIAK